MTRARATTATAVAALAVAALAWPGPSGARPLGAQAVAHRAVSPAATDTTTLDYLPAGTDTNPAGDGLYWDKPGMTAFTGTAGTLLIRSVDSSPYDGGNHPAAYQPEYRYFGSSDSTWHPITVVDTAGHVIAGQAQKMPMVDTVQAVDPDTGKLTLHSFWAAGYASGSYRLANYSTTDGRTWTLTTSPLNMSGSVVEGTSSSPGGVIPYQGIETLPDNGGWIMPIYFNLCPNAAPCTSGARSSIGLAASTDQGKSWSKPNLPFAEPDKDYSESTVIRRPADGKLVMIGRYDYDTANHFTGLLVDRVSDGPVDKVSDLVGMTWSAPAVHVPKLVQYQNNPSGLDYGASPRLTHVGNRIMLAVGRPGDTIAWNDDGTATTWPAAEVEVLGQSEANRPATCTDADQHLFKGINVPCLAMGSSGYMGVAVTDPVNGIGYIIGDTCHVWSCKRPASADNPPSDTSSWPSSVAWPNPSEDWKQKVWLIRFQPA